MRHCVEIPIKLLKKQWAEGDVNQQYTGSCGGYNYEKVTEESPVTKTSVCHLSLNLQDECSVCLILRN